MGIGPGVASLFTANAGSYNSIFSQSLTSFDAANSAIDIKIFDVYGFMTNFISQVNANGSYMGVTNVTTPCLNNAACTDASQAFFWDEQHPTARIHEILGTAFAAAVPEPETYAMLLAGLVIVGWASRRGTRTVPVAA